MPLGLTRTAGRREAEAGPAENQALGSGSTAAGTVPPWARSLSSKQLQASLAHLHWPGQSRNWLGLDYP